MLAPSHQFLVNNLSGTIEVTAHEYVGQIQVCVGISIQ